jgi:hypothetical protein
VSVSGASEALVICATTPTEKKHIEQTARGKSIDVSFNGKGKERLILDLRHVNKHVRLDKFKFEDWKTLKQYINLNSYGFVFDLKSGYHHVDIHKSFQIYLGFSWELNNVVKYFVLTVLPFELKSSAYIFSKVLRLLVKFWSLIRD